MTDRTKRLRLVIEIPDIYADDLDESAEIMADGEEVTEAHYLWVVTEEWMREEVGITIVSLPGEKCMSDDFTVAAYTGRIVGAHTVPEGGDS